MNEDGPYFTEDMREFSFPVDKWSWNKAQRHAAMWAEDLGDQWSRSRYIGKREVPCHDHEDWELCESCPDRLCYVFETYEGSYRGV